MKDTHVVVVGGGGTGGALAYDLVSRGFRVTLCEKGELTSGTTGRHHGQLHCGARYAVGDASIARECLEESILLRKIAPQAIEFNQGLFVGLDEEDLAYLPSFLEGCAVAGIPAVEIPPGKAVAREPGVNPNLKAAVLVPDGTIDAFRLAMSFFAGAKRRGARILPYHEVLGIETAGGAVSAVRGVDRISGTEFRLPADAVVNAAGAWAGKVAALAGLRLGVTPCPGTLLAVKGRLTNLVVSRLSPPGDGDILVPQRRLSIIGTTQWITDDVEDSSLRGEDLPFLTRRAAELVPAFASAEFHAAWSAPRPLFGTPDSSEGIASGGTVSGSGSGNGRELSRDFACVDHGGEGVRGFFSILGGKATVLRAMAEKSADAVCRFAGSEEPCRTAETPLPSWRDYFREEA